jgi:hypothetical protein
MNSEPRIAQSEIAVAEAQNEIEALKERLDEISIHPVILAEAQKIVFEIRERAETFRLRLKQLGFGNPDKTAN